MLIRAPEAIVLLLLSLTVASAAPVGLFSCFSCVIPKKEAVKAKPLLRQMPSYSHISNPPYPRPTTLDAPIQRPSFHDLDSSLSPSPDHHLSRDATGPSLSRIPPNSLGSTSPESFYSFSPHSSPQSFHSSDHLGFSHFPPPDPRLSRDATAPSLSRTSSSGPESDTSEDLFEISLHPAPQSLQRRPSGGHASGKNSGELFSRPLSGASERLSSGRPNAQPPSSGDPEFQANEERGRHDGLGSGFKDEKAGGAKGKFYKGDQTRPGHVPLWKLMGPSIFEEAEWTRLPRGYDGKPFEFGSPSPGDSEYQANQRRGSHDGLGSGVKDEKAGDAREMAKGNQTKPTRTSFWSSFKPKRGMAKGYQTKPTRASFWSSFKPKREKAKADQTEPTHAPS